MRYFSITSFKFDANGKSYPTKVCWQGQDITLGPLEQGRYVSFFANNAYYWLEYRRGGWQLLRRIG